MRISRSRRRVPARSRRGGSTALLRQLITAVREVVDVLDEDGRFLAVNPAHHSLVGGAAAAMRGTPLLEMVHPDDHAAVRAHWVEVLAGRPAATVARWRCADGSWQTVEFELVHGALRGQPVVVLLGHACRDDRDGVPLLRQARYDSVTGLPNRTLFIERLRRAVTRAAYEREYRCGVLFLDVDRFKVVNDGLGHEVGDHLLRTIAHRLSRCVRPNDTIARLGSDEFGILLNGIDSAATAGAIAAQIHAQFSVPLYVNRHEILTSVSVGIAVNDGDYGAAPELLRDADTALHRAKALGKARTEIFDRAMQLQVLQLLRLEADLRSAVWHEVLQLYYQPIVSLRDGTIVGAEALIRWHHPERGFVSPAEFIPVAEATDLIVPIGEWVLRVAVEQAKRWQDAGLGPLYVAVNLSARQFKETSIPELVEQVVTDVGLDRARLKLELTESSVMENAEVIIPALHQLTTNGITLALDDFGTGYSSLSYLKRLPLSTLKIDRSFIRDVLVDDQGAAIVRATIAMAHSLNLFVIAEGVETEAQRAFLAALACDAIQGYLYSRPVPADEFTAILTRGAGDHV